MPLNYYFEWRNGNIFYFVDDYYKKEEYTPELESQKWDMKSKDCSWGSEEFRSCSHYGNYDYFRKKNQDFFKLQKSETFFEIAFIHLQIVKFFPEFFNLTASIDHKLWKIFIANKGRHLLQIY